MPPKPYYEEHAPKVPNPIRAAIKAGTFCSWSERAPYQLLIEFDTIKLDNELDLSGIPSFLHQQEIDLDKAELLNKQKKYFGRVAEALKEPCGLTKKAFDPDALTIRLSAQEYDKLPEKWRSFLPKHPLELAQEAQRAAAKEATVSLPEKPEGKIPKLAKPHKEQRWVRRAMEELRDMPSIITPQSKLKGTQIGPLLCKLWENASPTTQNFTEMSVNLVTIYDQFPLLQERRPMVSKVTTVLNKRKAEEESVKKPKSARIIKHATREQPQDIITWYEPMSREQKLAQVAELEVAHCSPKKRYSLYREHVANALRQIDLPAEVIVQQSTKGDSYILELRKPDHIHQRVWSDHTAAFANALGVILNIEPPRCVHSRFQIPIPQDSGLQHTLADIQQQQTKRVSGKD